MGVRKYLFRQVNVLRGEQYRSAYMNPIENTYISMPCLFKQENPKESFKQI